MKTLVMKFGGASVATPQHFSRVADLIIKRFVDYKRIVVVVSAMGDTTNQLIALAKKVNPDPPRREYDMLISTGERVSISLLAMALAYKNKQAVSFTGSQSGIITCCRHSDARIVDVRPFRIHACLDAGKIAIVAGFQGVSQTERDITTLGRGGSDTTAVALAIALSADLQFYKDVSGIYDEDPKKNPSAQFQSALTYEQALNIIDKGAKILHGRCVKLAARNGLPLHIMSFEENDLKKKSGTLITNELPRAQVPVYEETNESN